MNYIRLPLKKAYNVRDLGGYPTKNGRVTKWKSFLRADSVSNLEEEDIKFLLDYGLVSVVDLRSKLEVKKSSNPFEKMKDVNYINIPLGVSSKEDDIQDLTRMNMENPQEMMPKFYISILTESTDSINEIFDFISQGKDGCILFHCEAGKDRTGVLAMLLLGICDVDKADIIANYMTTYQYIIRNPVMQSLSDNFCKEVIYSNAEYIEVAINYIINEFGTFNNYLISIGIKKDVIDKVKRRLLI